METNKRTIGEWLVRANSDILCLPRFQREKVWDSKKIINFLESIIMHPDRPLGVFLILEVETGQKIFPPRHIDEDRDESTKCRELLLDGQQRLTALWLAFENTDKDYRYYVKFNSAYEVISIQKLPKDSNKELKYFLNPDIAAEENLFPICLLNPLASDKTVDKWVSKLKPAKNVAKIKALIVGKRKIFSTKEKHKPYIIPFFKLKSSKVDKQTAIDIYKIINTNAVKLSDYYLSVAEMEKQTSESLYDIADELKIRCPTLTSLEKDEVGELILKIFCLVNDKAPSGVNCKNLPFDDLVKSSVKNSLFMGVEWAIEKFENLKIWNGKQLPSIVPLRVLPALHQHYLAYINRGKGSEKSNRQGKAEFLVNRYLWHAFLTKRYNVRANTSLHEDFMALKECFENDLKPTWQNKIPILNSKVNLLSNEEIKELKWPSTTNINARGILLACHQKGGNDPISGIALNKSNSESGQLHHIFPKSRAVNSSGESIFVANKILNCIFISESTNKKFSNRLPGTYLRSIFKDVKPGQMFDKNSVKNNLKTHNISDRLSSDLISIEEKTHASDAAIKKSYKDFIEKRAKNVKKLITKLLTDGRL